MVARRNKTQLYIVNAATPAHKGLPRLIRGSLKEVESLLRGEYAIRPATPEECHAMADVVIESAEGEPV